MSGAQQQDHTGGLPAHGAQPILHALSRWRPFTLISRTGTWIAAT